MELSFFWCWMGLAIVIFLAVTPRYAPNGVGMLGIVIWPLAALLTWIGLEIYEHFGGTWSFL